MELVDALSFGNWSSLTSITPTGLYIYIYPRPRQEVTMDSEKSYHILRKKMHCSFKKPCHIWIEALMGKLGGGYRRITYVQGERTCIYITETDPCIKESYKSSVKNKSSKIDCLHRSFSMVVDIWMVMGPQQYMASSQTHISHSHAQYCQTWLRCI
jgi:hypothetical protein